MNICLIVPFLDEEDVLEGLLGSLAAQRRRPDELLLVDDGSSDRSPEIAEAFAAEHGWVRVLRRPRRPVESDRLVGGGAMAAFAWAAERTDADVVGKIDADLVLPPGFLAALAERFDADERLGLAGAHLAHLDEQGVAQRMRGPDDHVHGATKLYRRACWEAVAPLPALMGWDTIDEVRARRAGWRSASFEIPGGDPVHVRRMGSRDGLLRGYRRAGLAAWGYGASPVLVGLGTLSRLPDRPRGVAAAHFAWGWAAAAARRAPRAGAADRRALRREQRRRLRGLLAARRTPPPREPGPPHLAVLLENQPYPYDPRVRAQVRAAQEAGYRVSVLGPTGFGHDAPEETLDGVRVLRYPVVEGGRGIVDYVKEFGLSFVRLRRLCRRLLADDHVDAVLVCNPPDFLIELARPFAARGAGVVLDDRELSPELFEAKYDRRGLLFQTLVAIERRAFRVADAVLVTNAGYLDNVTERAGIPAERVFVVGNGPDPERIREVPPRPELRRGRRHLVLWLGAMSTQEGLDLLIDAAEELVVRRGRSDAHFALVGPGDVRDVLAEEVARRGLADVVELPGRVDDDAVRAYLSTADVCVNTDQPNRMNDRAAMRKVLEYMLVGRPVVQFPLAEMRRLCGDDTLWAKPGDAIDLADRIAELLDDASLRAELGERGRGRVLAGLTWPDQAQNLLAALAAARTRAGRIS